MAKAGEVWIIDLGMVAKVRPCLLLTDYPGDDEIALVTVLPHTTALRGQRWELTLPKSFLKPGAFHLQQVLSVARQEGRLGVLTDEEWPRSKIALPTSSVCSCLSNRASRPARSRGS